MSVRVHELAKELKLTSKEVIDKLKKLKISAASHMSVLAPEDVKKFKESQKQPVTKAATPAKSSTPAKSVAPVKVAAPVAPVAVKHTPAATSIESVKKEMLAQKTSMKAAQSAINQSHRGLSATTSQPIRKMPTSTPTTSYVSTPPKPKPVTPIFHNKPKPATQSAYSAPTMTPSAPVTPAAPPEPKQNTKIQIADSIAIKDLSAILNVKTNELIQRLIKLNIFANINQAVTFEVASKVAKELGFDAEPKSAPAAASASQAAAGPAKDKSKLMSRAPIVTFMGHVDHGKTSLLDAIRNAKVAAGEAGGITQHIGAYEVNIPGKGSVTFLDTPGHEAFTAMRARGAKATDVVVLVVAADDGVMPQTIEAIDHAKAAGVPIIVAINKIDLPSANPDQVKKALMEHGLMAEEWGGKTIMVGVSAKTGKNVEQLIEMLALESELLELRADPDADAKGVVIEAELSKGSGVLATVLVQDGTLRLGDVVVVGPYYCRVRAMINDRGQRVKEAQPSKPVEILGLPGVPKAGDLFTVVKDEKSAKEIVEKMAEKAQAAHAAKHHISLEDLYEEIKAGRAEELKLIIKSDVQGSVEALRVTLAKIPSKSVRLNTIHAGIGDITESDVMLAAASDAVVIGFHVGIVGSAKEIADREGVDVRFYQIIYEAQNAIEQAMEGLLQPELKEAFVGLAEVRQVFKVSKTGQIAGCSVLKGKIVRNFSCNVLRGGKKIHTGKIESLKRFKDDAREVLEGYECGLGVSNFESIQAGDRVEVYEIQKTARKLE